ncbi:CWF19-like protein 2 [Rhinophrynus dorsalis]
MAAYEGMFESATSIDEKREHKKKVREQLLSQAKSEHEKAERRKEQRRLRGEDTWMLNDVNERIEELQQEHSGKKKKKDKHHKKAKKEKKKKSRKQKSEKDDDSGESSEDSEEEWVEATPSQTARPEKAWKIKEDAPETDLPDKRDEWMTLDFMSLKATSAAAIRAEKQKEKTLEHEKSQAVEMEKLQSRELNPFWKDGGTGLPPEEGDVTSAKKVVHVEDGGLSWLRKSYQRMKEQSERENRSLEDIVAARYGSMENFQNKLDAAERAASQNCNDDRRERWRRSKYPDSESRRFVRPDQCDERSRVRYSDYQRDDRTIRKESQGYKDNKRAEERDSDRQRTEPEHRRYGPKSYGEADDSRRSQDKSSSFKLKHQFLKPSEDEDGSFHGARIKQQKDKSTFIQQCSLNKNFQKPSSDDTDVSWKRMPSKDFREGKQQSKMEDSQAKENQGSTGKCDTDPSSRELLVTEGKSSSPRNQEKTKLFHESIASLLEKRVLVLAPVQERFSGFYYNPFVVPKTDSSCCPTLNLKYLNKHDNKSYPVQILSEEEMNKLGAKLVKAELLGNTNLAAKLRTQLEEARQQQQSQPQASPAVKDKKADPEETRLKEEQEVVLVRTDQSGRAWPVNSMADPLEPKGGRRKRQMVVTHVDKERVRYFHDDDNQSLKDLVKREKMGTAEDQNKLYMRMASKFMEKTDQDYYTLDDMFVSKAAKKERGNEEEERERRQAISEHQRLAARMEKCPYCFDNAELPKHLIIAIGVKVYLCLPNYLSLTEGHCLIVPLQHFTASTLLDEDIWNEIQTFRKTLVKMFESRGLDCVFLESNINTKNRFHLVYECIPLPKEVGDMAPIYFKKAIMESDEEWSMNKKLIDLSTKDIRRSVPKGLPYFSVDFGLQGGYAHVIEDQHKFPHYFGKEIIGGMLDLEPRVWRKAVRENFDDQRKKVLEFAQWWKPFDITKPKDE